MNRRHGFWLLVLALIAVSVPAAHGQGKRRDERLKDFYAEYQQLDSVVTAEARPLAEDRLAARLVDFCLEVPGDDPTLRALGLLFSLEHAAPNQRAIRLLRDYHPFSGGVGGIFANQWERPTPGGLALVRQLVADEVISEKERGLEALVLAREVFRQAGETGDPELARQAQRYADQFEKQYPSRYFPGGEVDRGRTPRLLETIRKVGVGKPAPAVAIKDVHEEAFDVRRLRGKVALVYFAPGKPQGVTYPTVRAQLEPLLARLKGRPAALVVVTTTATSTLVNQVNKDAAPPIVLGSIGGPNGKFPRAWGVEDWPAAVLVDARGTIRFRFAAPPNSPPTLAPAFLRQLDAALDQLVREAAQ